MKKIFALLCSGLVFSFNATGQSLQFLSLPSDPITISMGNSSTAAISSTFSFYNNSAAILLSEQKSAVGISWLNWQPDEGKNNLYTASGYSKIGTKLSISAGFKYLNYPSQALIDINGNETGSFSPTEYSFGAGLGFLITHSLSASINFNYISSKMGDDAKGSAFAIDAAVMYKIKMFRIGVTASNIGSKIDYGYDKYSLPSNIKLGLGIDDCIAGKSNLAITAEGGMMTSNSSAFAGIGAEYNYNKIVFVRAGAYYGDKEKATPSFGSFGLGFNLRGITLNAAYIIAGSDSPINNSMSLSLGYEF